jgi:tRNA (cytidine/uridine-2'-O-)-methyltransferase
VALNIVLFQPEIPPNTGNIARLCAATGCRLHLIGPLGFEISEKTLKRAGMDYWNLVDWKFWPDWSQFFTAETPSRFFLYSTKATSSYLQAAYEENDYLIFGRESKGLPESLLEEHAPHARTIPMPNPDARSLNLATSVAIVTYEALRQTKAIS